MPNRLFSSRILDLAFKFYNVVAVVCTLLLLVSLIAYALGFSFIVSLLSPEIIWTMTGFIYLGLFRRTFGEDVRTRLWLIMQIMGFVFGALLVSSAIYLSICWAANVFTGLLVAIGVVVAAFGLRGIRIHFRSKCLPQEYASSD